jgi:hypothetical protein
MQEFHGWSLSFASIFLLPLVLGCGFHQDLADRELSFVSQSNSKSFNDDEKIILEENEILRILQSGVLEKSRSVPKGTLLSVQKPLQYVTYSYRDEKNRIKRSSNGFLAKAHIPGSQISYYVSSHVLAYSTNPRIDPLPVFKPQKDYLLNYTHEGKPLVNFSESFRKRFGDRLNLNLSLEQLPAQQRKKWQSIYNELAELADRSRPTDAKLLFMDREDALQASVDYEERGYVPSGGAWTIAVKATAVRHGFPNVPCAEFMSQIIRQSYERAGYSAIEDFNIEKSNPLIYSNTALVVNLGKALFIAGWIPWDSAAYQPKQGAIMLNAYGLSPGHAYLISSDKGQVIVDNGAPRGRDLRMTSDSVIKMMYQNGVFFLPPGILPKHW